MGSTGDRLSRSDIPNLTSTKLDYTNWNAWNIDIARALCLKQVAHYIGMDDGVRETYDVQAPLAAVIGVLRSCGRSFGDS